MHKLLIIGMGPGQPDYLLPAAKKEIEKADCLIGSGRLLSQFLRLKKEKIYLEGHFNEAILYIKKNQAAKQIAVLVSGDPGCYSFLKQIKRSLKGPYEVIPGISSLQVAFAKIGESWDDAKIISLHGRTPGNLAATVKASSKVFLFTDSCLSPDKIALYLVNKRVPNRKAIVFENLGYPQERIIHTDLKKLSKMKDFSLCVMIIKK